MGLFTPPPAQPALNPTVVGPGGTRYLDCGTVAGVDRHIRFLQGQIAAHVAWPKRVEAHWQDIDELLERRRILTMESWLSPSDLPL